MKSQSQTQQPTELEKAEKKLAESKPRCEIMVKGKRLKSEKAHKEHAN